MDAALLIGYFLLYPAGEIISGSMRLDLWNAETIVLTEDMV